MHIHRSERSSSRFAVWATLTTTVLVAGCGNLTMGGFGNATVVVSGDAQDVAPSLAVTPSLAVAHSLARASLPEEVASPSRSSHEDDPEGEIEVDFMLSLISETGAATQLGDDDIEVRVDLGGRTEASVVEQQVPVARYTGLQVVFTKIQAEVDAGLIINGVPVTGEIRVEFENLTLPVTKEIDLNIVAGSNVELVLDLNAPAWLQAVDPNTSTVDATVFADLMTIVTR